MPTPLHIASHNSLFRSALAEALEQTGKYRVSGEAEARVTLAESDLEFPVSLAELLDFLDQKIHSSPAALPNGWVFDPVGRALRRPDSQEISLTEKENSLLSALLSRVSHREELLSTVWGYGEEIDTHTLETHIHRLRAKLKESGGEGWIETTEEGYRLAL